MRLNIKPQDPSLTGTKFSNKGNLVQNKWNNQLEALCIDKEGAFRDETMLVKKMIWKSGKIADFGEDDSTQMFTHTH